MKLSYEEILDWIDDRLRSMQTNWTKACEELGIKQRTGQRMRTGTYEERQKIDPLKWNAIAEYVGFSKGWGQLVDAVEGGATAETGKVPPLALKKADVSPDALAKALALLASPQGEKYRQATRRLLKPETARLLVRIIAEWTA